MVTSSSAAVGCKAIVASKSALVDLDRPLAEHGIGEPMALADRDRRKIEAMGDVTYCIDVRHRGLREMIDRDPAVLRTDGDPGFLQAHIGDIGMPSDREHYLIGGNARSIRQMRGEFL